MSGDRNWTYSIQQFFAIEGSVPGRKNENAREKPQQPGIVAIGVFSDCWKWGGRQKPDGAIYHPKE
jgi:hypothetical protein